MSEHSLGGGGCTIPLGIYLSAAGTSETATRGKCTIFFQPQNYSANNTKSDMVDYLRHYAF
jgi:hypothetical protein